MSVNSFDIFVINLKKDILKKEYIKNHFRDHGIENYTFIKAIDGREMSCEDLLKFYDKKKALEVHGRPLARGEIGCTLSHLECYKKIISQDLAGAFIFEDDVVFSADTTCLMKKIRDNFAQLKSGVVLLGYAKYVYTYNTLIHLTNKYCLKKIYKSGFAHGYYITHNAAKEMLSLFQPVSFPIDIWKRVQKNCSLSVYSCFPYCIDVLDDSVELSSIDAERTSLCDNSKAWYKRKFNKIRGFMNKLFLYKVSEYLLGVKLQEYKE